MEDGRLLNIKQVVEDYLDQNGWKAKANSNSGYSFSGLVLHTAGAVVANYTLNEIYPKSIKKAHESGFFHIHHLTHGLVGYCAGWSLQNLLLMGFGYVPGQMDSGPAKHFDTAIIHLVNFLRASYNEFAGAQAFSSVDTLLSPFVAKDKLSYAQVKQNLQRLVFSLNVPSKWGFEMPFTNLTFDWTVPQDLAQERVIIAGKRQKETYADFQKEMNLINRAFIEVMLEGDDKGRLFTFPIPTYNLTPDFNWNSANAKLLFRLTAKYGLPYFQNYLGSDLDPASIRAMCCRLNLNLKELMQQPGSLWGKGDSTGSIGNVTINLNRLACQAGSRSQFFQLLTKYLNLAKQSLEIKRKKITLNLEKGFMPYTKAYLGSFRHYFSTIGVIGGHEACLNLLGKGIDQPPGKKFIIETLKFIRAKLVEFQKETGHLYNLEATPAESTSYRLALLDRKYFCQKKISGSKKVPYLTNSTQLPVDLTDDLWRALQHQNDIQTLYSGGTVFHCFLGEEMSSYVSAKTLVKKIAQNTKLPYFTITPTFSICPDHGRLKGKRTRCPQCGKATEVYSRIVGYFRPVSLWNQGKQQEFKDRKTFII